MHALVTGPHMRSPTCVERHSMRCTYIEELSNTSPCVHICKQHPFLKRYVYFAPAPRNMHSTTDQEDLK